MKAALNAEKDRNSLKSKVSVNENSPDVCTIHRGDRLGK